MTFELKQNLYKPLPRTDAEAQRLTSARARILANDGTATAADIELARQNQYASEAEKNGAAPAAAAAPGGAQPARDPGPMDADAISADLAPRAHEAGRQTGVLLREGATAARDGAVAVAGAVGTVASDVADAASDPEATASGAATGIRGMAARFANSFNAGGVAGAVIGGVGALTVSSLFGAGPIKWLLMLLLVPAGLMLGSSRLDGPLNNFFSGIFGSRNRGGDAGVARVREVEAQQNATGAATDVNAPSAAQTTGEGNFFGTTAITPVTQEQLRGATNITSDVRYAPVDHEVGQQVYMGGRNAQLNRGTQQQRAQARHDNLNDTRLDLRNNGISVRTADGPDFRIPGVDTGMNQTFRLGR